MFDVFAALRLFYQLEKQLDWIKKCSTEESKQALRMILSSTFSCTGHELWKLSTVFVSWCYQPFSIENYLLPSRTIVPTPYSHSAAFVPQSFSPLSLSSRSKFQVLDLSQSDIQIVYGSKINDCIRQYVNRSWTGILEEKFVVHGQYIRFAALFFISIY